MFQPREEGFDGARHMIEEGVLDAAGTRPADTRRPGRERDAPSVLTRVAHEIAAPLLPPSPAAAQ